MVDKILTAFVLYLLGKCSATSQDYCARELCLASNHSKHIACSNDGSMGSNCSPDSQLIEITEKHKKSILKRHNEFRSRVAGGGFYGFAVAARMAFMQWDDELEHMAELNVKRCVLRKSECFATSKYSKPGQNLAYNKFKGEQSVKQIIMGQINMWTDEYRHASIESIITSKSQSGHEIGHFLQTIRDTADRIGCAVLRQKKDGWTYQFIACKYNKKVELYVPIYKMGHYPAERCEKGSHTTYRNLCKEEEIFAGDDVRVLTRSKTKRKNDKKGKKHGGQNQTMNGIFEWLQSVDPNSEVRFKFEKSYKNNTDKNTLHVNIENA